MGTPVHDDPKTGPKTRSADPPKKKSANVLSYQPAGARGLNTYSENIPSGADVLAAFDAAVASGEYAGKKLDRIAIVTGGIRQSAKSVHGGSEIVSWTPAGGLKFADEAWRDKVANPPAKQVAPPASTRTGGDAPADPGDEQPQA